jgi:hypothetical protein
MLLAAALHFSIPDDEPIDLFNVAFGSDGETSVEQVAGSKETDNVKRIQSTAPDRLAAISAVAELKVSTNRITYSLLLCSFALVILIVYSNGRKSSRYDAGS